MSVCTILPYGTETFWYACRNILTFQIVIKHEHIFQYTIPVRYFETSSNTIDQKFDTEARDWGATVDENMQ
jgi:hypothetical protein